MPTTLTRPNRYPAACVRCGARIEAGDGELTKDAAGKWAADHPGACPPKPTTIATPTPVTKVHSDGIYRRPSDGQIFKVQIAKQGNGRLYAKRLELRQQDGRWKATFAYAAGEIHNLLADWRLTADEAALFGKLYGICVYCVADLTDERSIAAGYGPTCAKNNGLPWG